MKSIKIPRSGIGIVALLVGFFFSPLAQAGSILDRLIEREAQREQRELLDDSTAAKFRVPDDVQVIRDVSYGAHARQKFDVYLPRHNQSKNKPIIFMVHGGAWVFGNKGARGVVENKMRHWLMQGAIFISTNYRLVPDVSPLEQAADIATAVATAQHLAAEWSADPQQLILMGHSAGAHLVALLAADAALVDKAGMQTWLGTIALDIAAYDVNRIMAEKHHSFYDKAFGKNADIWTASSPYHVLSEVNIGRAKSRNFLAVCSKNRAEMPCPQAQRFVEKGNGLGMSAQLAPFALSHSQINQDLGLSSAYTELVDKTIAQWQVQRRAASQ
jgi:arylformamidase